MRLHQFSMKQLLLSMLGICCGLGGIAFAFRRTVLPIPASDNVATAIATAKLVALVTGIVVICLSIIPLLTNRRPVQTMIVMLVGLVLGLFSGGMVAHAILSTQRVRAAAVQEERIAATLLIAGGATGAVLPLILIVCFDARKRARVLLRNQVRESSASDSI